MNALDLVRCIHPADHHPARIATADKDFVIKLDFKDTKFAVKIKDIHRILHTHTHTHTHIHTHTHNTNTHTHNVKYPIFVLKKCSEKKYLDLLLTGEESNRHYVRITNFNTFRSDHTLRRERQHFCRYCLQTFSTEEILKRQIKDWFRINDTQSINMPKKFEYVRLKNFERKIKSPMQILNVF